MSRLELFTGPMFSGKSKSLLEWLALRETTTDRPCAIVPAVAGRFHGPFVATHSGDRHEAVVVSTVAEIPAAIRGSLAVAIDEAQFFGPELVGVLESLRHGQIAVAVAGLDLDFRACPFDPIPAIAEIADEVHRLGAVCASCGGDARFTQRLIRGRPARAAEPTVRVGGEDLYEPRCQNCFERLVGYCT